MATATTTASASMPRQRSGMGARKRDDANPWPARWAPQWALAEWPSWCRPCCVSSASQGSMRRRIGPGAAP